jgi:predicted DNA binding CopG/RHH family protein
MPNTKRLRIPKFNSEDEEVRWYDRHRKSVESAFLERLEAGDALTLKEAMARAKLRPVTIRLAVGDVEKARTIAARKGIRYQTYIKMLLREALQRESRRR